MWHQCPSASPSVTFASRHETITTTETNFSKITSTRTVVLQEVITFLDAAKAFDEVEYCSSFEELMKRRIPPVFLSVAKHLYWPSSSCIMERDLFQHFSSSYGNKIARHYQSKVFWVYRDNLFLVLKNVSIGCATDGWLLVPWQKLMTSFYLFRLLKLCVVRALLANFAANFMLSMQQSWSPSVFDPDDWLAVSTNCTFTR